jgi:hypothetical protein
MSEVKEAETAYLRIEIKTDERVLFSESREITVHAANEWRIGNNEYPEGAYTLSLFVTPNSPSVDNILSSASDILERLGYKVSFEGYQSHSKERIYEIAGAIYLALKDELKIKYIVPPASFEKTGQKIRSASQILMHERGTCLDLAVLLASCLEAAGLNPVLFLIPGHAFSGLWTTDRSTKEKMSTSTVMINELVDTEAILPIEATAFTSNHSFEDSVSIASAKIKKNDELAMIDVVSCRLHGIKPMNLGGVR